MWNRYLSAVLCLLAAGALAASVGCTTECRRNAGYVFKTDLRNMSKDACWVIGMDEPSIEYEDTFPPYSR